jgi:CheY-like chemotaxis protein
MKKIFVISCFLMVQALPCLAGDFIVEFVGENYRETQVEFSFDPLIYHSVQVNSSAGPKLLVLTGNDYTYRKWLRHYIAGNKTFIAKIPDDRTDEFISSKAFEIDVGLIHPFAGEKWTDSDQKTLHPDLIQGDNHILIVDPDEKRSGLIQGIVEKMGYRAAIFKTGDQALESFVLQPGKFKLIVAHHTISGMPSETFVDRILKINQTIPVVIDTGYKNQIVKNKFALKFSGSGSVHIRPVILKELEKTIETLTRENA